MISRYRPSKCVLTTNTLSGISFCSHLDATSATVSHFVTYRSSVREPLAALIVSLLSSYNSISYYIFLRTLYKFGNKVKINICIFTRSLQGSSMEHPISQQALSGPQFLHENMLNGWCPYSGCGDRSRQQIHLLVPIGCPSFHGTGTPCSVGAHRINLLPMYLY